MGLGMPNPPTKRNKDGHAHNGDGRKDASYCTEAVDVPHLGRPRDDGVEETKGNDVLGTFELLTSHISLQLGHFGGERGRDEDVRNSPFTSISASEFTGSTQSDT